MALRGGAPSPVPPCFLPPRVSVAVAPPAPNMPPPSAIGLLLAAAEAADAEPDVKFEKPPAPCPLLVGLFYIGAEIG